MRNAFAVFGVVSMVWAGQVHAQTATPAPVAPAAQPAPAVQPAPPAPAAEPVPAVAPAPAAQPAPAAPAATQTQEAPPPPQYQQLGRPPAPEEGEGEWDPWEHLPPGKHKHEGFLLRLGLGFGYGWMHGDGGVVSLVDEVSYSGPTFGFSIAIGASIVENFALHVDIFNAWLLDADREVKPGNLPYDEDVRLPGFGLGATYYFMPANVYVSAGVGLGQIAFSGPSGDGDGSQVGLGLDLMLGKEWWVGTEWGLGLAGQAIFISADDPDLYGSVSGLALNLVLSATHN